MTGDTISVRLIARAKVNGLWRAPGEVVVVDPATAAQLDAAGAIEPGEFAELASGLPGFDEQVAAVAKMLAEAAVQAVVEQAVNDLTADRDALRERLHGLESENRSLQARNYELDAEIAEMKAAIADRQDPPATDAPQKGAAARKG